MSSETANPDLDGKNLIELLDLLVPVPDPAAISLLPQTIGWVVLAVVVSGLGVWAARRVVARHRANAYRRAALAELATCGDDAARIAALLRRTALAAFPRQDVAGLTGEDWVRFLDQAYGGKGFSGPCGQTLLAAPYQSTRTNPDLTKLAQDWITSHKSAGVGVTA